MEGIRMRSYTEAKQLCSENCAYAALMYLSCLSEISYSRLCYFVDRYTLGQFGQHTDISRFVINSLLTSGHIYEPRGGFLAALPPYAIQRESSEWIVLGDARVDRFIANNGLAFQVTSSVAPEDIFLERILLAEPEDATNIFKASGVRHFKLNELLNLVPDCESLSIPLPWSDFVPGAYAKWEVLNKHGHWDMADSILTIGEGICRGIIVDSADRSMGERYFYKHSTGWSPITSEEASLWVFSTAANAGDPYDAKYLKTKHALVMPLGLPYAAYVMLRYICKRGKIHGGHLVLYEIDYEIARNICKKLQIRLDVEVGS
jgi:hypothetical protein